MKAVAGAIAQLDQDAIRELKRHGKLDLTLEDGPVELLLDDVEVQTEDIPGWLVAGEGGLTVALDIDFRRRLDRIALTLDEPQELRIPWPRIWTIFGPRPSRRRWNGPLSARRRTKRNWNPT